MVVALSSPVERAPAHGLVGRPAEVTCFALPKSLAALPVFAVGRRSICEDEEQHTAESATRVELHCEIRSAVMNCEQRDVLR